MNFIMYPDDILGFRTIENRAGVSYDANNTKTLYADDVTLLADHITAIEEALGVDLENLPAFIVASGFMKFSDARFKVGNFTRNQQSNSGNVAYTGVGFLPKVVIFLATIPTAVGTSFGFSSASSHHVMWVATTGSNQLTTNWSIYRGDASSWNQAGRVNSMDSDGFTLEWNKGGSPPAGTINVIYLAFR